MSRRGSITIGILIGSLFLAVFVQMILIMFSRSRSNMLEEFENYQLRKLCGSVLEKIEREASVDGNKNWPEVILEPGHHRVQIEKRLETSTDGLIKYLSVGAVADNQQSFYMRKLKLETSHDLQEKAKQFALIYKNSLSGSEYLSAQQLYTSTNEEVMPAVKFLNGKAISSFTAADAAQDGLSSKFYYLPSSTTFSFSSGSKIHGSTVFVNSGSISIASNCIFYDRVMIVSGAGSITIGKNVNLKKAIIIAKNTVTIDEGSQINGLIVGNQIVLKGPVSISRDEEVVEPFSSAYFLNTL